ncbi:hypothetical protein GCM10010279_09290 [Streptomyces mutabilis]|nr:hypothetical protein GCM10010279_09290 [Streptomyces mutabilis]
MSSPSAAETEGSGIAVGDCGVVRDGEGRSWVAADDLSVSSVGFGLPQAVRERVAVSVAMSVAAGGRRRWFRLPARVVLFRIGASRQLSVRGKETSTLRFFLRPASVELSAMGYCSP